MSNCSGRISDSLPVERQLLVKVSQGCGSQTSNLRILIAFCVAIIDTIITFYPERLWGSRKSNGLSDILRKLVEKGSKSLKPDSLLHSIVSESMKYQAEIPPTLLGVEGDAEATEARDQITGWPFPSRKSDDQSLSYLEIFNREIKRVVSLVCSLDVRFLAGAAGC